jgi:molybdopterin-containing oxidoreductase family iron-sulfur binding subunit
MTRDDTDQPGLGSTAPNNSVSGLVEIVDSPEYRAAQQNEFPEGASEWVDPVSRRRFLGLMGASIAMATGAGCNLRPAPAGKIVPYTTQPDQMTPGVPLFFATATPLNGYGTGVLVRSNEGRPTKIEGNPDHPSSLGGLDILTQATLLDLYDPDRSRATTHNGLATGYDNAVTAIRKELYGVGPNGEPTPKTDRQLWILTEPVTSPTLGDQITRLLKDFPQAHWVQYDTSGRDNLREGIQKAFGKPLNIHYDLTKADVILSIDADFLCSGPGSARYSHDYAIRRKVRQDKSLINDGKDGVDPDHMNRLYAVECMPTNTGAVADHRLALTTAQIQLFAREVARELGVQGVAGGGELPAAAKNWIKPLADDLRRPGKGKTLVVAGDHLPAAVHALVFAINNALGNLGQTVIQSPTAEVRSQNQVADLKKLTDEMAAKKVHVLLVLGTNPAYTAPPDLNFVDAIANVPVKLQMGTHLDETSVLCEWHIPQSHYLESWGDIRGHDGTLSIQQPLIAPLTYGKSISEFLADLTLAPARDGLDIVKNYWRNNYPGAKSKNTGDFEIFWQESVRAGVVKESAPAPTPSPLVSEWAKEATTAPPATSSGEYELNFRLDPTLYDGRFANNGWMQELPKPLTLITWDNALFVSPATAAKLGVTTYFRWTAGEHGRAQVGVVELTVKDKGKEKKVAAPVWVLPGHADGAVTVHLGFGRTRAGRVASTPHEPNAENLPVRGFNANVLRSSDSPWMAAVTLAKTPNTYFLACTQGQWSSIQVDPTSGALMDRKPVRHGTLKDYREDKYFGRIPPIAAGETDLINANVPTTRATQERMEKHNEEHDEDKRLVPLIIYQPMETLSPNAPEGQRRRWAMAIDLSACTGCSSCVVACISENNTPVIGKYEVTRGRIMHWISLDRYYGGTQENPNPDQTYFQPRMCVQCETAPCEIVCPVGATVHSVDGLNDMVYNRCVGTRYCSNNCPYKVRRFNFLTYADWETDVLKLHRNPEVSVRSRGVMEKCTFCVQRIRNAEIVAEREQRKIQDGEIMTACQAACPSGAIVFGDLNDPGSVVGRWKNEPTNYGLLMELNTKPRLTHLTALRNPNPVMKGA